MPGWDGTASGLVATRTRLPSRAAGPRGPECTASWLPCPVRAGPGQDSAGRRHGPAAPSRPPDCNTPETGAEPAAGAAEGLIRAGHGPERRPLAKMGACWVSLRTQLSGVLFRDVFKQKVERSHAWDLEESISGEEIGRCACAVSSWPADRLQWTEPECEFHASLRPVCIRASARYRGGFLLISIPLVFISHDFFFLHAVR